MTSLIVTLQSRATLTGSRGVENMVPNAYSPLFAETNGVPQEDPFFQVSPAFAVGSGYVSEESNTAPAKK